MTTPAQTPDIEGLPPGAVVRPLGNAAKPIEGLPQGAVVRPIGSLPSSAPSTTSQPEQPGLLRQAAQNVIDPYVGFAKGMGQTAAGIGSLINKIPGIGETLAPKQGVEAMQKAVEPQGAVQNIGAGTESIAEFALGEHAVTGAAKLGEMAKIAQFLEKYPRIAAAVKSAMVGAAQGTAKSGSPVQGAEEGAIAGAASGAGSLASAAISKSSQGIKNIATEVGQKVAGKVGASIKPAASFADAAEQVEAAAKPTFQKLDQLSNGEFNTFQNTIKKAKQVIRRATSIEDLNAAEQERDAALKGIDDLIEKHADQFQPNELQNARSAWRDMKVMEKVHSAIEPAFTAPEDIGVTRKLRGNVMQSRLNSLLNKTPAEDLERVVGKDGIKNLYQIADFYGTPANTGKFHSIVADVAKAAKLGPPTVVDWLIKSPRGMQLAKTAIETGTSPKIYAPIMAEALRKTQSGSLSLSGQASQASQ